MYGMPATMNLQFYLQNMVLLAQPTAKERYLWIYAFYNFKKMW